eukprot:Skav224956  [mRNA]  locus=scaffold1186:371954:390780:+ [translate_table: standard]
MDDRGVAHMGLFSYQRAGLVAGAPNQVGGTIDAPLYYGYEVRVLHPTTYDTTQHSNWYLWLLDSNAYVLQGSQETMRFNKFNDPALTSFFDLSWGMYNDVGTDIPVQLLSTRPSSLTNDKTEAAAAKLCSYPRVFNTLSLKGNTQYGFRARCDVPDFNPVTSANSFFIEFGYRSNVIQQRRRFANVVEAPSIAALTNAEVYASTNLVNYADRAVRCGWQRERI